jgi:hypothetical protein
MHSGSQLFGRVCKCINCARKRNDRVMREARKRHPATWLGMIDAEDQVEELKDELKKTQAFVSELRVELREKTLNELREEEGAE